MTPSEAGRELARAAALVRSVSLRMALWRSAGAIVLLAALVLLAVGAGEVLRTPGSALPMVLSATALLTVAGAGFAVGLSLRTGRLAERAAEIERARGLAAGDLVSAIELGEPNSGSADLAHLHRARVATALSGQAIADLMPVSRARLRAARQWSLPGLVFSVGAMSAAFAGAPSFGVDALRILSRPWEATFPPPPPPLRLEPSGGEVLRGDGLEIVVTAVGRSRVHLGQIRPGKPPESSVLEVHDGHARGRIGEVDEPVRFWAEDDRGSATDTFVVVPLDPLTITDLRIDLEYPGYLRRPRDVLSGLARSLRVPQDTRIGLTAHTNHPVEHLGLVLSGTGGPADTVEFRMDTDNGSLSLDAGRDAVLRWWMVAAEPVPGVRTPPPIELSIEDDLLPVVTVVRPDEEGPLGIDQTLSLVIEALDDHGLGEVGLTWWREAAGGRRDPAVHERLAEGSGQRHVAIRPVIDLEESGFLPDDEFVGYATASDLNPRHGIAQSDTFRVRLSGLGELRHEMAERSESISEDTRSLRERVGRLAVAARDAERRNVERVSASGEEPGGANYGSSEIARDLAGEASEVEHELTRLREELEAAGAGLESSALSDPELQRRLNELEELFQEILDSGLRERIEALEEALRDLDGGELRDAMAGLSRQAADLEQRLDRALGLLERVAIEQSLKTARADAEALAERQGSVARGDPGPAEWSQRQEVLAAEAEDLARQVEQLSERLAEQQAPDAVDRTRRAQEATSSAASHMRSGARAGTAGEGSEAVDQSRSAEERMTDAERELASAEAALSEDWRLAAMKDVERASSEALELAREQEQILDRLRSRQVSEELAGRQSAVREGLDNLAQSLAEAGRKTALMDRRVGPAAARAGDSMDALAQTLASGGAVGAADEQGRAAVDALGDLAASLMASRRAMGEASSATGMEEALERLAGMGKRQGGLNAESGDLLLLMEGGRSLEDRLDDLAVRQNAISSELRDLAHDPGAQELGGRPDELAAEAESIARTLAAGVLDGETIARQERLFRSLLDAGRSLEKDARDSTRRESTAARPRVALRPDGTSLPAAGPRHPYPTEEEMRGLTSAQRRLVYDYFDRLNGDRDGGAP
ncbi:MAG: hypothetical protein Q8W46_09025 [Candidatus Palauibacterales bacterium]|nr:hypothetical protein [Candidatus Palauibacterales bacterium]